MSVNLENIKNENLKNLRNFFNMTQMEFIDHFLKDDKGNRLLSLTTYSNLENGQGIKIDLVIEKLSNDLGIDKTIFNKDSSDFFEYINEKLKSNELCKLNAKNKIPNISLLVNQLTDYFANQILSGQLSRGDQIESDRDLAEKMCTSRSAVREALKVLQILGMIDIKPGQGTYLNSKGSDFFSIPLSWALFLSFDQIHYIIEVRNSLECLAVSLASKSASHQSMAKLTQTFNDSTKALQNKDLERFVEEDIKFHLAIAECSGNPLIYTLLSTIQNLLRQISSTGINNIREAEEVYEEHQEIYGAILIKDTKKATDAVKNHAVGSAHRYKIK